MNISVAGEERQKQRRIEYAKSRGYQDIVVLEDISSGLNENRKGLMRLFEMVSQKQVEAVFITYRDRLTRFGFKYLEAFFNSHGCRIECLDAEEVKESQQELIEDLIAIVTSFAGRIYGARSHQRRRVVEAVEHPLGYRLMKCPRCGLEEDRDIVAVKNLLQRIQIDVPASTVHGESPPMKGGGKR